MTSTQNPAALLLSLAAQVADAKTEAEASDLYFLGRGVFYSELDALEASVVDAPFSESIDRRVRELRSAWSDLAFAVSERAETKRSTAYGLVSFSDGSFYGGRK